MNEVEILYLRLEAAEKQREEAVKAMQAVQPGILCPKDGERLERLKRRAYHIQNQLDAKPSAYNMDRSRAELAALCWAISKISGKPFSIPTPQSGQDKCR